MISLNFKQEGMECVMVEQKDLLREGIFTPMVTLPNEGQYDFDLNYSEGQVKETFKIGRIEAFNMPDELEHEDETPKAAISFLKEQQWKTKFMTGVAQPILARSSVAVVGEVLPRQQGYAEIVAPVEGILSVGHNQNMVIPGSVVRKGDVLLTICPPISGNNSWTDLQLSYERAKSEYERARRLKEKDAISQKDYEELRRIYLIHKSGFEAFLDLIEANGHTSTEPSDPHLHLRSQISGTVAEVLAKPGQNIVTGQKLMTVLDASIVWIQMNVYEKDYFRIGEPQGAQVKLPGIDTLLILEKENWRVLSRGEFVDPDNRTIPILIEIKNPNRIFKIGQVLQLDLYTSAEKKVIAIPESSVFDEDVQEVVFVQIEGELFEKRKVETGIRYKGWVEIKEGIESGERVVTEGGYMVKLASTSTDIGHPHVH
jgi:RND family efflux transporter MFP subunit